jgi:hypothetical protein
MVQTNDTNVKKLSEFVVRDLARAVLAEVGDDEVTVEVERNLVLQSGVLDDIFKFI